MDQTHRHKNESEEHLSQDPQKKTMHIPMMFTRPSYVAPENVLSHLYGEWSVWHSDLYKSSPSNQMLVNLSPSSQFQVSEKKNMGPLLLEKKWAGEYDVISSQCFGTLAHGFEPWCTSYIRVNRLDIEHIVVSLLGIGFDEAYFSRRRPIHLSFKVQLDIIGKDDIYLSIDNSDLQEIINTRLPEKGSSSYHLIRSVRINQPQVNIPLSTFLFTQVLGSCISLFFHDKMCHPP